MPNDFAYDPESQTLTVGTGAFAPVSQEAWNFEVSGLRVLRSWLGYRMKTRKGKKSSPLDDIRPHPLDPDQRTPAPPVHHRAHHRSRPQSRRPLSPDSPRPVDPSQRPTNPHPRQPQASEDLGRT